MFKCYSATTLKLGVIIDFQGLVFLIWGAAVPLIYYAFICNNDLQVRYWTLTSIAAVCCSFFNVQQYFGKPHLQPFKALGFGCLALSFFITTVHSMAAYGLTVQTQRLALKWIIYTLICHTFCAAAHATDASTTRVDVATPK